MLRHFGIALAAPFILLPCVLLSQTVLPTPASDRSFYEGKPVTHPEALSGLWEAPDGHGGMIGIHLMLDATIPGNATTPAGAPQSWLDLQLSVYQYHGTAFQPWEMNGGSDSPRGGGVRFENGRLTLHYSGFVDIDLVQHGADTWMGRLHRGSFDERVVLRRPNFRESAKGNSVTGTWKEDANLPNRCLHVVEQAPGEFTGWFDTLQALGSVMVPPNRPRPAVAFQRYGELLKVSRLDGGKYSFGFNAYGGLCCPHTFVGTPNKIGSTMEGEWPAGMNQSPHPGSWKKMKGDSCVTSR